MDYSRSISGVGEDNIGIPDDLRCKRSDGKQWRCTAMSMPDKTVCEKHYIQAKKRAANSAMKASMKKRKSIGESDNHYESKSGDDMDLPHVNSDAGEFPGSGSAKKYKEKLPKSQINYSPEAPSVRSISLRGYHKSNDDLQRDGIIHAESRRSFRTPPPSAVDSSRSRSQKMLDSSPMTGTSEGSSESSDDAGGQPCHQCRRSDRDRVTWCLRCDRRGYCDICISTWYSDVPLEEIQRICPACRGSCSCKVCLRGDNLIKARIREIPVQDKLQYLYCLLSAVLPVVNQIHHAQSSEVELEKKLHGNIDLARTKLNADEQMCCNFCRIPIIDYHRHCPNCSYDLCLSCCKDVREASRLFVEGEMENMAAGEVDGKKCVSEQVELSKVQLNLLKKYFDWRANREGSLPCPQREYGGCGCSVLTLKRIFKMNWVAKLVKNVDEMVSGCKVCDSENQDDTGCDLRLFQAAHRENGKDNFLYHPSSQDIKTEGIRDFRIHWSRGEPVIVKEVCDISSMAIWDPLVILRGIRETSDEKLKDVNRTVKAINCFDWTEVDIELSQFIKGYSEGRIHENGQPEMLKLKDWPSPSASEEFLMYQRPDFISKFPLLEFIHPKWGLLNVAAKLPHYSLQNDVGPKIQISYGTCKELDMGDSVENLHLNMRDMVFLLVHLCDVKLKVHERTKIEKVQETFAESEGRESPGNPQMSLNGGSPKLLTSGHNRMDEHHANLDPANDETIMDQGTGAASTSKEKKFSCEDLNGASDNNSENSQSGALWDVFRRQDIPKLIEYLRVHKKEFEMPDSINIQNDSVQRPLYDGVIYLNNHHKQKLKEGLGIEPWSFEQHLGEAVFIPAGCPFQARNLQSTVQLGLDFLSPESLKEAITLAEEIRGLPNDHEAKLQILEVGKISLYAASWAIKEVQKLVLDPKLGPELGFEDPNLTSSVSKNLEEMVKRRQVSCL
ncbi:hypothetical protein ACH5RR_015052 [Cinchona calisaya]|uniref:Lysine-specific demethylase JMJ25 n=1 Tax=Cinchona calisaya TaxID=153742 RepID=A0ABD2ZT82_9GENT